MKEQNKTPEKIQLSNEERVNPSDAQFKTLVIRMLTELVEFGHKLDEKMKAMLSETKENVQGTNSDGKETETQINGVDQKEERNIEPEKNEETRIRKNEERLKRDLTGKKGLARSIPSHERQGPTSKITVSSKAIVWNGRADKVLLR